MKLRKGLSFVAFGFLFTLVDFNLEFSETVTVNLFPDFVGWLLFLLAWPLLTPYTDDQPVLRWLPLLMLVYTAVDWLAKLVGSPMQLGIGLLPALLELVYLYLLFGCLIQIAKEHAPALEPRLGTLRILNLALAAAVYLLGLLAYAAESGLFGLLVVAGSVAALVAAVYTCVTLFQLRSTVG